MSAYDEYHRQYYEAHKKEYYELNKQRRETLKILHRCRECGKQDAFTLAGRTRCADCVEKDTERRCRKRGYKRLWKRLPKEMPEVNRPRGGNGICWQCNKHPVLKGKRVCPACYEKKVAVVMKNLENSRKEDHPWRRSFLPNV